MRHVSFCRSYRCRGTSRPFRCESLEHRWLLSITVDTLVDEADGSIVDGDVSLRDAIVAAVPGETIDFDASLDGGTILLILGELSVTKAMTIDATSLENGLTIDAAEKSRIFNVDDGDDATDSPVTIRGLTLTGGNADGDGGAIRTAEDLTVTSSTISGNSADRGDGGGIWASGDVTVTSSTISQNQDVGYGFDGGGIWSSGDVTVTSSTISRNETRSNGGGIVASDEATVTIENSIVAGNTDSGTAPDIHTGAGMLTVRHSLIGDNTGTHLAEGPIGAPNADGNLVGNPNGAGIIDPLLAPLADNGGPTQTHAPLAGSPAIDAGDPDFAPPPEFDQRGNPRVADGNSDGVARIDMGALELLRGDVNGDGEVNGLDVDRFVDVLLNGPPGAAADMNQDGVVNGLDVDPFGCAIVGGCNRTDIPVVGDWNGNGTDDIGVFFSGAWQLDANGNGSWDGIAAGDLLFTFRRPADTPVVGGGNAAGAASLSLLEEDFATEIERPGVPLSGASTSSTTERSSARLRRERHVHDGDDHSQLIQPRAVERVMGRRLRLGRDGHRSPQKDIVHEMASDWHATVDRAFGDDADWIG